MRWENPPGDIRSPDPSRSRQYDEEAAELRAHPDRWALVDEFPDRLKVSGRVSSLRRRGLTVATRGAPDGTVSVYAKYDSGGTV